MNKPNEPSVELFVPGRLCLFGEHSDWAGSYRRINTDIVPGSTLVVGLEQGIYATAEASNMLEVRSKLSDGSFTEWFRCPMDVKKLRQVASEGSFFCYVAGVAAYILQNYDIGGIRLDCHTITLPMKKGLSSSAAICVLTARAFSRIYSLSLTVRGEMEAAYNGEMLTPSRCGRMDQGCAYGSHPIHMVFNGEQLDIERIRIGGLFLWVFADLNATKNTLKILASLNKAFPFAVGKAEESVQHTLGAVNESIVSEAINALARGDSETVGRLMTEAQCSFDENVAPLCPDELTSPKLHAVLGDPDIQELVYGGKGVGSQGDGSVQFLAKDDQSRQKLHEILHCKWGIESYDLTLRPQKRIRKAVVPLAGFGTRLFPATKTVRKEFFPVVDHDGLVKPVLLVILEELDAAGIDSICLIVKPGTEDEYRQLFQQRISEEHAGKLSTRMREYELKMRKLGDKLFFAVQEKALGFGHAVYQSHEFAAGEPVLLVLGDHLFRTKTDAPCSSQLIEVFEKTGKATISISKVPLEKVIHYGIVGGKWEEPGIMNVSEFSEKPSVEYATENLAVYDKLGKPSYYSVFGQYILTQDVYNELSKMIDRAEPGRGEVELTPAIDAVRASVGLTAFEVQGERFDTGIPEEYRKTVWSYCKRD